LGASGAGSGSVRETRGQGRAEVRAIPWVTCAILLVLTAIYLLETAVSAAGGHPGVISHSTLVHLGGLSRNLALGAGQPWRLLTVSLLHLNPAHLVGNGVALLLVGLLLEPIVGRGWFALIYLVGGLGGAVASMAMNAPEIVSVGASGAIMCVLSATLVLSFHAASYEKRKRMRILSLRVMIPALLPLGSTHGHVDYSGHIGGVLAGMVMGFLLQIFWAEDDVRPPGEAVAGWTAAGIGLLSLLVLGSAAALPSSAPAETPGLIPMDDVPATLKDGLARAGQLAAEYPDDPRARLYAAMSDLKAQDETDAEVELTRALQSPLLGAPELPRTLGTTIRATLSGIYHDQGRVAEAHATAAPLCAAPDTVDAKMMVLMRKSGLCDPA